MSRIFLAEELELEREVVIKVLAPGMVDEGLRTRFRHEVMQTARLQHPTIVPLIEVGSVSDERGGELPFFIMPYVRGGSVRSRLEHEHQLSLGLTLRLLRLRTFSFAARRFERLASRASVAARGTRRRGLQPGVTSDRTKSTRNAGTLVD
jgi:serine/threonine protein kinase